MNKVLTNILWILHCSNGSADPPTAASILQQLLDVSLLQLLAVMHYLLLCNILAEQVRNMLKGSCVLLMRAHTAAVQWFLLSSYYTLSSSINVPSNSFPSAVISGSFFHKIVLMQILEKKKKGSQKKSPLDQSHWINLPGRGSWKKSHFLPFSEILSKDHLIIACHNKVLFFSLELRIIFFPIHTWGRSMFKLGKEVFKNFNRSNIEIYQFGLHISHIFSSHLTDLFFMFLHIQAIDNSRVVFFAG